MTKHCAHYAALLIASSLAVRGDAAPALSVSHLGLNDAGNRQWVVSIAPDPSLFASTPQGFGGSVSTELAIEIVGAELASATKNSFAWPYNTPGLNPFTGAAATGVVVDLANDRIFAALTSTFLTSGQSIALLQIETIGDGATQFNWGGHELLVGTPFSYTGSRLAQAATNFNEYQGQIAVPAASADFDGDGAVDGNDFLIWQRGLRTDGLANRSSGDADSDGMTDGVDLKVWRSSFGVQSAVGAAAANQLPVPEPTHGWLAVIACLAPWLRGLRGRIKPTQPATAFAADRRRGSRDTPAQRLPSPST